MITSSLTPKKIIYISRRKENYVEKRREFKRHLRGRVSIMIITTRTRIISFQKTYYIQKRLNNRESWDFLLFENFKNKRMDLNNNNK